MIKNKKKSFFRFLLVISIVLVNISPLFNFIHEHIAFNNITFGFLIWVFSPLFISIIVLLEIHSIIYKEENS